MNLSRSAKSELVAAFLLGGLIALLFVTPARSAEAFRLDRLAIVRFSPTPDGRLLRQEGVLDLAGDIAWRGTQNIARPANAQEWALNRTLVLVDAWLAFHRLGGNATANFEIRGGSVHVPFGDEVFMAVGVSPFARTSNGNLVNISTRARLRDGETVIAGFVVEDRPRTVLVRAVGPSLARFGVSNAHPDPWLAVKRGNQTIAGNDDWSNQPNSDRIVAAAAHVGAFPLDTAAFDGAVLVILPPGAYTVQVASDLVNVRSRDVLIEVYSVPEDIFD